MSRKHIIYDTKAIFAWCQSHQNIDILAPRITKKAAKQLSWCQDAKISAKLVPRYQDSFAREAIWASTLGSPCLPRHTKIIDFTTHTTTCCNEQKAYHLLYFSYILCMPETPKYRHLGIQNQHFRNTTKPGTQLPHPDTRNPDPCCQES